MASKSKNQTNIGDFITLLAQIEAGKLEEKAVNKIVDRSQIMKIYKKAANQNLLVDPAKNGIIVKGSSSSCATYLKVMVLTTSENKKRVEAMIEGNDLPIWRNPVKEERTEAPQKKKNPKKNNVDPLNSTFIKLNGGDTSNDKGVMSEMFQDVWTHTTYQASILAYQKSCYEVVNHGRLIIRISMENWQKLDDDAGVGFDSDGNPKILDFTKFNTFFLEKVFKTSEAIKAKKTNCTFKLRTRNPIMINRKTIEIDCRTGDAFSARYLIFNRNLMKGFGCGLDWQFPLENSFKLVLKELQEKNFMDGWHLARPSAKIILKRGPIFSEIRSALDIAGLLTTLKEHPVLTRQSLKRLEYVDIDGKRENLGKKLKDHFKPEAQ